MNKFPLTIADFERGWQKALQEEDDQKHMPIHPLGSFCTKHTDGNKYCKICNRAYVEGSTAGRTFKYSKVCLGKRRWWFFGRWTCPKRPHHHVECRICGGNWFESLSEKE